MERHFESAKGSSPKLLVRGDGQHCQASPRGVDGEGYPDGVDGNEIPLISRIIAVADAYNAMTSDRPYRDAI